MAKSEADWSTEFDVQLKMADGSASLFVYGGEGGLVAQSTLPPTFTPPSPGIPSLVLTDGDSTLIQNEVIDELAHAAGVGDEVRAITESAMAGGLDFSHSLHRRVALLKGLPTSTFSEVRERLRVTAGARELIDWTHEQGAKFGVVSGGFVEVLAPLAEELGIDYLMANHLETKDGVLTGRVTGPVVDAAAKVDMLREWSGGYPKTAVAVGDGANDIPMLQAAGVGIAFCAKPAVLEEVPSYISTPRLDLVIPLLGR